MSLVRVPYIHYLLRFQKDIVDIRVLVDASSEVNNMTPVYISKLGLQFHPTNVGAQIVDSSTLDTFEIVLANFQMEDKLGSARFFQETFLVANTTIVKGRLLVSRLSHVQAWSYATQRMLSVIG